MDDESKLEHKSEKERQKEEKERLRQERKVEKMKKRNEKRAADKAAGKTNVFEDFKKFISRGNVIDMAVGVIIATAFGAIVSALVSKIVMPVITWLIPGDFAVISTVLPNLYGPPLAEPVMIEWGIFIDAIITFLLVALILFIIVKIVSYVRTSTAKIKKAIEIASGIVEEEPAPAPIPVTNEDIVNVLVEIRDELKKKK